MSAQTPYCVAKGCVALPPVAHLEAHLHWGCAGPEQVAELLTAYDAVQRAEVLREAADLLDSLLGDNEHLAREWDWWDAATIPASSATLLRRMADGSAT